MRKFISILFVALSLSASAQVGGGIIGGSNWSVNGNDIYPKTATTLMVWPGSTSTNARLFDFRVPSNLATSPDTVGVISWSTSGTAAEKRRISLHNAAMEFEGPSPSYRINASGAGGTVGGAFVQERANTLQHYIQSERDVSVRWNFAAANPAKLGFAGWHDNFGIAIGSNTEVLEATVMAENDLLLKTFGQIGSQRKGVLFSAISEAERDAWTPTSAGTMIYNETEMCYNLWTGTVWKSMCTTIQPTLYTANGTIASEFRTVKYLFPLIFRSIYNPSGGSSGPKASLRFQSNQVIISTPLFNTGTDSVSLEVTTINGIVGRIPRIFGVGTIGTLIVNSSPSGTGSGLTFNGSWHNNNTFLVGINRESDGIPRARVINRKDGFTYGLQVWPGDTLGNSRVASLGFFNGSKGIYYEAIEDTLRLRVNNDNEGLHLIDLGSATSKINFIADQYAFDPTKLPTPYADDAAAGAAGLLTGRWYQTDGTGAAPLNVAGILMIKQ